MGMLVNPFGSFASGGGGGFVGIVQTTGQVQVSGGSAPGSQYTITPAAAFTSGHLCVLMSSNYMDSGTNGRISAVSFNGVAAVKYQEDNDGVFSQSIWAGYAGSGSAGCVITLEAGVGGGLLYYNANIVERDDAVVSSPSDVNNVAAGTSASPSISVTTTNAHDFVVAVYGGSNNQTDSITAPGGWTTGYIETDGSSQVPCGAVYKEVSSTGVQTATFTVGASHAWQMIMAAFKLQ